MTHAHDRKPPEPPPRGEDRLVERFTGLERRIERFQGLLDELQEGLLELDDEVRDLRASVLTTGDGEVSAERLAPRGTTDAEVRDEDIPDWLEREFEDVQREERNSGEIPMNPSPIGTISGVRHIQESEELELDLSSLLDEAEAYAEEEEEEPGNWGWEDDEPETSVSRITKKKARHSSMPPNEEEEEPETASDKESWRVSAPAPPPQRADELESPYEDEQPSKDQEKLPSGKRARARKRNNKKATTRPGDRESRRERQKKRTSSRRERTETGHEPLQEPKRETGEIDSLLSNFLDDE